MRNYISNIIISWFAMLVAMKTSEKAFVNLQKSDLLHTADDYRKAGITSAVFGWVAGSIVVVGGVKVRKALR